MAWSGLVRDRCVVCVCEKAGVGVSRRGGKFSHGSVFLKRLKSSDLRSVYPAQLLTTSSMSGKGRADRRSALYLLRGFRNKCHCVLCLVRIRSVTTPQGVYGDPWKLTETTFQRRDPTLSNSSCSGRRVTLDREHRASDSHTHYDVYERAVSVCEFGM